MSDLVERARAFNTPLITELADRIEALESLLCGAQEVIRKTGGGDAILNDIDATLNRSHGDQS